MANTHLLSVLIWLPVIGGALILALGETRAAAARWASLRGVLCVSSAQGRSDRHTSACERPTPRGSIPTTSYRSVTFDPRTRANPPIASIEDPPGPPGLMKTAPVRSVDRLARRRASPIRIVGPSGRE